MRVVVIGAGIAGLSAARAVLKLAPDAELTVLEGAERAGGLIHTERTPVGLIEHGPDSLVTGKPQAMQVVEELGLQGELVTGARAPKTTFVIRDGRLRPLPAGLFSGSLASSAALLRSPLFSPTGKLRMLCESLVPRRAAQEDESLASFVTRRFGREFLARVVEPLMTSIHGLPAHELSARAALPMLVAHERSHGSVSYGLARARRRSAPQAPPFASLRAGMGALSSAMRSDLGGRIHLGAQARAIQRDQRGRFRVTLRAGASVAADALILATPAAVAARLSAGLDESLSHELTKIEHTGFTSVHVAFRREQLGCDLPGTGIVVPESEGRRVKACTWVSEKWPERAPSEVALVRCFVRAPVTSAAEAVTFALNDLADLVDLKAPPCFSHVVRREHALPAYRVGHMERMHATEQRTAALGAFALCGNYLHGLGIPECIASGQLAAQAVLRGSSALV